MATHAAPEAGLTERQSRNERELGWVSAYVAEVPETAEEWPTLADGERVSFATEWINYMAMAEALIRDYWDGELTVGQQERLFALLRQIEAYVPLLAQMGLYGPELHGLEVLLYPEKTVS
jgi:hypothetical protein